MRGCSLGSSRSSGTRKLHILLSYEEVMIVVPSWVLCFLSAPDFSFGIGRTYQWALL